MMNTLIFKALALGLLSLALISGPAVAAGPANCPAFNAAMVDAAAMASDLVNVDPPEILSDNPAGPSISCRFFTDLGFFDVAVGVEVGVVAVTGFSEIGGGFTTRLHSVLVGLTRAEVLACRAQVLQSFVWNQHCAPFLP